MNETSAPRRPSPGPPRRRPGSVRRTSTILMHWPGGPGTQLRLDGRARDLITLPDGSAVVASEASMSAGIGADRTVEDVSCVPHRDGIEALVGARGGGHLRAALERVIPEERRKGTPLYLLLDDVAGASLIAAFAWTRHQPGWSGGVPPGLPPEEAERARAAFRERMEGICSGFRPGSSALAGGGAGHNTVPVGPLAGSEDPLAWHELDPPPAVAMRRARLIDVWATPEGPAVHAMFRDSCWEPDGTEIAVHEYSLDATADRGGVLTGVRADPRVLPFPECPGAAPNAARMAGSRLGDLRTEVLDRLRATDCCTHLNDALRALAEVPVLAGSLGG